jgi:hypothetical protein
MATLCATQPTGAVQPGIACSSLPLKENELNGLYFFIVNEKFLSFKKKEVEKEFKATALTFCNSTHLKNLDLTKIVEEGRLAGVVYKQGKIEEVIIHNNWVQKITAENASNLLVKIDKNYNLREGNIRLIAAQNDAYQNMTRLYLGKV